MPSASELLARAIRAWVEDPESDVVYAEPVAGRWAVRMRQETREATTVWWTVGARSIRAEAYVLPAPTGDASEVYRLCLVRNRDTGFVHFALDREGAVVIRGRIPVEEATLERLDLVLGEIYTLVETTFRPLIRAGRERTV